MKIVNGSQGLSSLLRASSPMCRGRGTARTALHEATFAVAILLAVAFATPALAAMSSKDADETVSRVLATGDYQRELPLRDESDGEGEDGDNLMADPDWWRNEGETQAQDLHRPGARDLDSEVLDFEIPPALRQVLNVLMWIVFVAGGALVAYYLLNEARIFARWKKGAWEPEGDAGNVATAGAGTAAANLEDPDSLAARGEYAAAVHALLLHSITLIRERGVALSTSLTSREIVRRAPLGEREKDALRALVDATEVTHFGGRGATEADFATCRDLFQRIARASAGGVG